MAAMEKESSLIVCFGEMLIDFVLTVNGVSLAGAPGFVKASGGARANVAIPVAKLGGKADFVGKLGEDEFGQMLARILEQNGVNCEGLAFDTTARTALAFVTLKEDGHREFMFYRNPSADMLLTPDQLNLDLIKSAHHQILNIWDSADVIKVSDDELMFLTRTSAADDEPARSLMRPTIKLLLVTLGKHGCKYYTQSFSSTVEAFHVDTVDTTGVGDSFVDALLWKLVNDMSILEDERALREVLRFSNACGALTTVQRGAIPALPTEAQALALINSDNV